MMPFSRWTIKNRGRAVDDGEEPSETAGDALTTKPVPEGQALARAWILGERSRPRGEIYWRGGWSRARRARWCAPRRRLPPESPESEAAVVAAKGTEKTMGVRVRWVWTLG